MIRTINELLSVIGKNIEDIQDPNVSQSDRQIKLERADNTGIDHIWVNKAKGATTVKFIDGGTVTVRKSKDTPFDVYYAVASAVAEKIYGSNHAFQKIIEKNTTYQKPKEKKVPCTDIPTECEFTIRLDPACEELRKGLTELRGEIKEMKCEIKREHEDGE